MTRTVSLGLTLIAALALEAQAEDRVATRIRPSVEIPRVASVVEDPTCANSAELAATAVCVTTTYGRLPETMTAYMEAMRARGWSRLDLPFEQIHMVMFQKPVDGRCKIVTLTPFVRPNRRPDDVTLLAFEEISPSGDVCSDNIVRD